MKNDELLSTFGTQLDNLLTRVPRCCPEVLDDVFLVAGAHVDAIVGGGGRGGGRELRGRRRGGQAEAAQRFRHCHFTTILFSSRSNDYYFEIAHVK